MSAIAIPARFALVGLLCAGLHNAILIAADAGGLHYAVGCLLSYLIVVVVGFGLHVRFTFRERATGAAFWRYASSMAANYPLTLALLFLMCDGAGWPVAVAGPVATALMFAWNYAATRWAILRPASPPNP